MVRLPQRSARLSRGARIERKQYLIFGCFSDALPRRLSYPPAHLARARVSAIRSTP
jgi:hypothetical protein